jgi:hypothetical protein
MLAIAVAPEQVGQRLSAGSHPWALGKIGDKGWALLASQDCRTILGRCYPQATEEENFNIY